ncbi:MAG: endonuclease/exonuclease/phosphatase family protein [Xanthomonadales bacterium]|nr:endonuclease/exonuclease/phosphatase family protein [Xanthomonadales bacterium]
MRISLALLFLLSCPSLVLTESRELKIATYNVASGLRNAGDLEQKLSQKNDPKLIKIAAIIQHVRADILLLNEFDYQAGAQLGKLFQQNYLSQAQLGQAAIDYPYTYSSSVNTGINSGLDLNGDGKTNGPADAWGFGFFPGQYGMQVLSRYPIDTAAVRGFQKLKWASMPQALQPIDPSTNKPWYSTEVWNKLRLSSKSHWDIPITIAGKTLHFLVMHPTPPVFDGPEDRNGRRNHDEIRLFADYIEPNKSGWIIDDKGQAGGLKENSLFVIAGDLNADPVDGDSTRQAIAQLLQHPAINNNCSPQSSGAVLDSDKKAGVNLSHKGNPATDTGQFNPAKVGNLRLDYVLPAKQIMLHRCGVFWPSAGQEGADWVGASDHHLVWVDITL